MEEKKNKEVVKPTYEELQSSMYQMTEQLNKYYKENQYLIQQINNMNNTFTRLNYLFKVLENSQHFNSDFIISCVDEIETCRTIPEENTQDNTQDNTQNTEEKN